MGPLDPGGAGPRVAVVIPTHDRRDFVAEAVASVLGQTAGDLELVVVDDGSTDGTAEVLQACFSDSRLRVVTQENRGVSAARNRGAAETAAPWLAFLDSDDQWLPDKLARQLAVLGEEPDQVACYTDEIWFRRGRWANPRNIHRKHSGWIFEACLPLCIISPSSILLARAVFDALGGFDETMPACEDYDLWLRLTARHPVRFVPERLIVKRNGHPGQLSQAHWGLDRFRVRALWKLALDLDLPEELRCQALEELARKAEVVALGAAKRGAADRAAVFQHSAAEARRCLDRISAAP